MKIRSGRIMKLPIGLILLLAACATPAESPDTTTAATDTSLPAATSTTLTERMEAQAVLDAGRTLWESQEPKRYRFTYVRTCLCLPEDIGPFEVTVESGSVVSVTYEGEPVDRSDDSKFQSIDDFFDVIQRAITQNADQIHIGYHPTRGYPVNVMIDWDLQIADEETIFAVTDLTPIGY